MNIFNRSANKPRHISLKRAVITVILLNLVMLIGLALYTFNQVISVFILLATVFFIAYLHYEEVPEMIPLFLSISILYLVSGTLLLIFVREYVVERSIILLLFGTIEYVSLRSKHRLLGLKIDIMMPLLYLMLSVILTHDPQWCNIGLFVYAYGAFASVSNLKRYKKLKSLLFPLLIVALISILIGEVALMYSFKV